MWGRWEWSWNLKGGLLGFPSKNWWNLVGEHEMGQGKGPEPDVYIGEEGTEGLYIRGVPGYGMTAVGTEQRSFNLKYGAVKDSATS